MVMRNGAYSDKDYAPFDVAGESYSAHLALDPKSILKLLQQLRKAKSP
jgi:hypothetical protein